MATIFGSQWRQKWGGLGCAWWAELHASTPFRYYVHLSLQVRVSGSVQWHNSALYSMCSHRCCDLLLCTHVQSFKTCAVNTAMIVLCTHVQVWQTPLQSLQKIASIYLWPATQPNKAKKQLENNRVVKIPSTPCKPKGMNKNNRQKQNFINNEYNNKHKYIS